MNSPCIIWLTGLAGSGKTTIGQALYENLKLKYKNLIYLDGDELREILGHYAYDKQGRIDMALKRAKFAKFLNDQGMIVIVTTISMFNEIYDYNRKQLKNYYEIYIECDMHELVQRDQKGLYTKALNKEIDNVVGVDIEFDKPKADLVINNSYQNNLEEKVKLIIKKLALKVKY